MDLYSAFRSEDTEVLDAAQEDYVSLNRWVFKWRLKVRMFLHSRMSAGREFQVDGAATEKARRASSVCMRGTTSSAASEERRARVGARVCTSWAAICWKKYDLLSRFDTVPTWQTDILDGETDRIAISVSPRVIKKTGRMTPKSRSSTGQRIAG